MQRQIFVGVLSVGLGLAGAGVLMAQDAAKGEQPAAAKPAEAPVIQLAILLDTSNSMDGLINQARTQLWKIVNELATAKRNGRDPELRVALYEYGNNSLPKEQGHVRKIVEFTDDLDKISEELFALTTNGGDEYCGQVISDAVDDLAWSTSDDDLKLIFIAGNEPFTQGTVDYKQACEVAIRKGITVSTIFCGPEPEGVATGWQDGAKLADGSFLAINQDAKVAAIKTPFDEKLAKLSGEINKTYVVLGKDGERKEFFARQARADTQAAGAAPGAAAERAAFKAGSQYSSAAPDLVRAIEDGTIKLSEVKEEELPEEIRKLDTEKRGAYLKEKSAEREKLQADIKKLSAERARYIAEEHKKSATVDAADSFDAALVKAVREQAGKRRFEFRRDE